MRGTLPPALVREGAEILGEIARGFQTTVLSVRVRGEVYALKLSTADDAGLDAARAHFHREASLLACLQHPVLPRLIDVGDDEGRPYLLLELLEGKTLAQALAGGALEHGSAVSLAIDVAEALGALHARGHVHRDVKPANIVLAPGGGARLIDLGLAARRSAGADGVIVGTLAYCSPEQAGMLKRPVDARSDLYALGVVLYECLAGAPPFVADDAGELVRRHAVETPARLRHVDAALADVVAKLLAKDPDDRVQSATALIEALLAVRNATAPTARRHERVATQPALVREAPLTGRDVELGRLRAAWSRAMRGAGGAIIVAGGPGAGKTRLVGELVSEIDREALVLQARALAGDPTPLAVVRAALDGALPDSEERLRRGAGDNAPWVAGLSPRLQRAMGRAAAPGAGAHEQFYEALARLFLSLPSPESGAVLWIDDAQWIDASSRQVLRRIAAGLGRSGLLLVLTARDDRESADAVRLLEDDLEACPPERVELAPLDSEQVHALATGVLGRIEPPPELAQELLRACEGNPFAVNEYLHALLDAGALRFSWGRWVLERVRLEQLALPDDVIGLLLKRMRGLPRAVVDVLRAASIGGARFDAAVLARIVGDDAAAHLAAAADARVVAADADVHGGWAFVHDRVREALLTELDADARRGLHQRWAEALEASATQTVDDAGGYAAARHRALGFVDRDPPRAFAACRAAGTRALQEHAVREALDFLEQASAIAAAHELPLDGAFLEALGLACAYSGRQARAIEWLGRAVDRSSDRLERAARRAHLARLHLWGRNVDAVWAQIYAAFDDLDEGRAPPSVPRLLLTLARAWRSPGLAQRRAGTERKRGADTERSRILAQLYEVAGFACYFQLRDDLQFPNVVLRGLVEARHVGPSRELVNAHLTYSALLAAAGRGRAAQERVASAARLSLEIEDRRGLARARVFEVYTKRFTGDLLGAERLALGHLDEHGPWLDTTDFITACGDLMHNYVFRGHLRKALAAYERGVARLHQSGDGSEEEESHPDLGFAAVVEVQQGNPERALTLLARAREALRDAPGSGFLEADYWSHRIVFHLARGEADALDEPIDRIAALLPRPRLVPFHARKFFVYQAHARLAQATAATADTRALRLEQLRAALDALARVPPTPEYRAHHLALSAGLARLEDTSDAWQRFADAEAAAWRDDCPWPLFVTLAQRARWLRDHGRVAAAEEPARTAGRIAAESGWDAFGRQILTEFALKPVGHAARPASSTSGRSVQIERHLDALLQVSLASATQLDPALQCRAALDAIVRLLGAERAFLFRRDAGDLVVTASRGSDGRDLDDPSGFSKSIIDRVLATGEAVVYTGAREGGLVESDSIVAHDLRSVLCAPLRLRDSILGAIYVDSRLARGVFTSDDLEILAAMANHIAVALETTRIARVEVERRALEKDLELTEAVQSLFLPPSDTAEIGPVRIAGYYESATRCSGDWWWYGTLGDKVVVFASDVTGHGPAAAMVSVSVATALRIARTQGGADVGLESLMQAAHTSLTAVEGRRHQMTMAGVALDVRTREVSWCRAGAPALFLLPANGGVEVHLEPSSVLGGGELQLARGSRPLAPGDRVVLFTDGVLETTNAAGRDFGMKGVRKVLDATRALAATEARAALADALRSWRGGRAPDDDVTFVIVDCGALL